MSFANGVKKKLFIANFSDYMIEKFSIQNATVIGFIFFICLLIVASKLYPGGSKLDSKSKGYSWSRNYICDLSRKTALNGEYNPARPFHFTAMVIFNISIAYCLLAFGYNDSLKRTFTGRLIQATGCLSMLVSLLLFTRFHDRMVFCVFILTSVSIISLLLGLIQLKKTILVFFGVYCLLLLVFNFIIFYTSTYLKFLPVLQKFTLSMFMIWISIISINSRINIFDLKKILAGTKLKTDTKNNKSSIRIN